MDPLSAMSIRPPLPTPPGSPRGAPSPGPPVPLQREMPQGPDPFLEERAAGKAAARAGALCPVNQHGCMYFSASEWRFCRICCWRNGHAEGEAAGELAVRGGPITEHLADIAAGRVVVITRDGLRELFNAPATRSFLGTIADWHWDQLTLPGDGERARLTRPQLHNLLMEYGAPSDCLTDQLWLDLQAAWPPATPAVEQA